MLEMRAMNMLINTFMWIHFTAMGALALYGCHRLWFMWQWLKLSTAPQKTPVPEDSDLIRSVTVQLPLYNEQFVARRVIDAAAKLDWPTEKLQIQVLDDSNDETMEIVDSACKHWSERGINIEVIRRSNRHGYKAGALAAGLKQASGELVAIFDADFVPEENFLKQMVPHFNNPNIGMVQARWGFINSNSSWLTQVQALLLGPHFGIEHRVRNHLGAFFNFNGTAGIWRCQTIVDAGGWCADTVTEDLDLSYRAQLKGWRFKYVDDVAVPSELPVTLSDFRTQQQRWAKGSMQTARKILPQMLRSSQPLGVKAEACAHLLANLGWICGAVASLTLYPAMLARGPVGIREILLFDLPLFLLACMAILSYFFIYAFKKSGLKTACWTPLLPLVTLGLSPSLAVAGLNGLFQRGGTFNRTPKYGLTGKAQTRIPRLLSAKSSVRRLSIYTLLIVYSCIPLYLYQKCFTWVSIPFLAMFPISFFIVAAKEATETFILLRK